MGSEDYKMSITTRYTMEVAPKENVYMYVSNNAFPEQKTTKSAFFFLLHPLLYIITISFYGAPGPCATAAAETAAAPPVLEKYTFAASWIW